MSQSPVLPLVWLVLLIRESKCVSSTVIRVNATRAMSVAGMNGILVVPVQVWMVSSLVIDLRCSRSEKFSRERSVSCRFLGRL